MKKIITLLLLAILILGFTGCGSAAVSSDLSSSSSAGSESSSEVSEAFDPAEKTLAFCMGNYDHPVNKIALLGFIESAQKLGYKNIIISGLPFYNSEKQQQAWSPSDHIERWEEDLAKNRIDGVAVWTGDDSSYELMKEWNQQDIKIVIPYYAHSYQNYKVTVSSFVGANVGIYNQYDVGVLAADYIGTTLREKEITSGIVAVSQQASSGVTENVTTDGFVERMAEAYPEFDLTAVIFEGGTPEESIMRIKQYMPAGHIVAAFGNSSGGLQAWSGALAELGITDCLVVGRDYSDLNLELLQNGTVDALIASPLYDSAYESVIALDRLLRGEVFEKDEWQQESECQIVTAEGTDKSGIQYYLDLITRVKTFSFEKYLT